MSIPTRLLLPLLLTACAPSHPFAGAAGLNRIDTYVERGTAAVPELRSMLDHEDGEVRHRARTALGRITGQWGATGDGIDWKRSFEEAAATAASTPGDTGARDTPVMLLHLFGNFDEEFC